MLVDYRDIAIRAIKTFIQAFLATLAVGIVAVDSFEALQSLSVASLAAGISALQNWIKETL